MEITALNGMKETSEYFDDGGLKNVNSDEFLTMFIAQLENQDPLQPMDNHELILQLAQMTTVEQMGSMTSTLEQLTDAMSAVQLGTQMANSSSLLGKNVNYYDVEGETILNGTVDEAQMIDGEMSLIINGEPVSLNRISTITNSEQIASPQA